MNESEVFFSLARSVGGLHYRASLLGHELELTRRGYVDPSLWNGQRNGEPVHYLPESLARDSLELVVDSGRISLELENHYSSLAASGSYPFEETYRWESRGRLDGFDVIAGLPSDAPRAWVDGEEIGALVLMALHLDPSGDDRDDLAIEPFAALVECLSNDYDDEENDTREYRAAWARLLALREAAFAAFHNSRADRLGQYAEHLDADIVAHPTAVEEEAPLSSNQPPRPGPRAGRGSLLAYCREKPRQG